jgi:hypothetical protein
MGTPKWPSDALRTAVHNISAHRPGEGQIGGYARPVIARKGIHPMSTADGGAEWWYHP